MTRMPVLLKAASAVSSSARDLFFRESLGPLPALRVLDLERAMRTSRQQLAMRLLSALVRRDLAAQLASQGSLLLPALTPSRYSYQ